MSQSQNNILVSYNGDFESGLTSWRFFEVPYALGSIATVVTTDVAQGTKAIMLTFVSPDGTVVDRGLDNWDTNVPVVGGENYTVSVQAKTLSTGSVKVRVTFGFFDVNRTVVGQTSKESILTNSYQTVSVANVAPAMAAYCWIAFRLMDGNGQKVAGTLFLDDVKLLGVGVQPPDTTTAPDPPLNPAYTQVNRSTLTNKVMCGYQGWFAVPSDAINRGWFHYKLGTTFAPGSCKFDLWPDMAEMESDEKYAAPGFYTTSGAQAYVFSSQNRKTVTRHFKWMGDYGIDGVFVQRFATEVFNGGAGQRQFNNVLASCKAGAHQYGRVYAVMYDLSGMKAGEWLKVLTDWQTQIVQKGFLQDSCYLHHNGKPVVAVWGIGFNDGRAYTLSECDQLIDSLKKYGNTVMVGVPTYWRTLGNDAVPDPLLHTIIKKSDIVSPWFVGRFGSVEQVAAHTANVVAPDIQWCKQNGKDYLPVVFPGFSWHNMNSTSPLNQIPRLGGKFLWKQNYEYINAGSTMIFQAMFDEIDEATAIFKCTNDPPVGASTFVTYEGLPSDHYLWLVGEGGRMLRKETVLTGTIPERPSTGVDRQGSLSLQKIKLNQNYPNPFNPSTIIGYSVSSDSFVKVLIYNIVGQKVRTLVEEGKTAGAHQVVWNGLDDSGGTIPSGIYICRMQSQSTVSSQKMLLIR